jgi:hypothetical protein
MAMRSLGRADKTRGRSKSMSAVQEQQKKLGGQQADFKKKLPDASLKKTPSMPWKRGTPQPPGKQLGQGSDKPGPQVAMDRTRQAARDRSPQSPQTSPTGPGQNVEQPEESRGSRIMQALMGMTGIGQRALQKLEKFRQLMDAFRKNPRPAQPYNPAMQQQVAQQAPQRDQQSITLRQQLAQRKIGLAQQQQSVGRPGLAADQQPKKKDLGGFKKNKEIGRSRAHTLAD